jgi:DNA invertase Pin-like site-specific DNA recombinase
MKARRKQNEGNFCPSVLRRKRETMKVCCYARVSSERQAEKDLSIPAQLKALRRYASERGWEVVAEYVDEAESARTANRPKFKEMIAAARRKSKPFDAILVWKLSRFARNREDSIIYKSLLRKHGVQVISINEPVDDSAAGKLLEGMIEVIDEFYSTNLAEDVLRGMAENTGRRFCNGGPTPFGYRRAKIMIGNIQKSKLEPEENEVPIVRRDFQMSLAGQGGK